MTKRLIVVQSSPTSRPRVYCESCAPTSTGRGTRQELNVTPDNLAEVLALFDLEGQRCEHLEHND